MQVNFLVQLVVFLRTVLGPWAQAPLAAVTVLVVSVVMALLTNLVNRHFIDYDRMRRARTEVNKWQAMKKEAAEATDERVKRKLQLKVKRRERYVMKLQGDIGKQSFMPMLVTLIPFMLVYTIMNGIFLSGLVPIPVVYSPLNFGQLLGPFGIGFGWPAGSFGVPLDAGQGLLYIFWYILVSFAANLLIQRILGTSMTPGTTMLR